MYGADYKLRSALEEAEQPYVLAVTGQQCVWMGFGQRRVKAVKTQVPADAWTELRVAAGTKGPRVFDWAALTINHPYGKAWQRFLLLRRSRSQPEEITAYLVFGAADTSLEEMARAAGTSRRSPVCSMSTPVYSPLACMRLRLRANSI